MYTSVHRNNCAQLVQERGLRKHLFDGNNCVPNFSLVPLSVHLCALCPFLYTFVSCAPFRTPLCPFPYTFVPCAPSRTQLSPEGNHFSAPLVSLVPPLHTPSCPDRNNSAPRAVAPSNNSHSINVKDQRAGPGPRKSLHRNTAPLTGRSAPRAGGRSNSCGDISAKSMVLAPRRLPLVRPG